MIHSNPRSLLGGDGNMPEIVAVSSIYDYENGGNYDNRYYDYIVRMFDGGNAYPVDPQLERLKQLEEVKNKSIKIPEELT